MRRILLLSLLMGCANSHGDVKASPGDVAAPRGDVQAPHGDVKDPPSAPPAPKPTASKPMTQTNPLSIEWRLEQVQRTLTLHYTITNPTKSRYYVCDKLISGAGGDTYRAFEGLGVQNGGPDTVMFVLGTTAPAVPAYRVLPVTYVPLDPGGTLQGTRTTHWPLVPFNAHNAGVIPLKPASQAVFLVFAFQGEPPTWREWPGVDGKPIRAPEGQTLAPMKVGPIPLPR